MYVYVFEYNKAESNKWKPLLDKPGRKVTTTRGTLLLRSLIIQVTFRFEDLSEENF